MLGDGEARTGDGGPCVGKGDLGLGDGRAGLRSGDRKPGEADASLRDGDDSVPQSDLRPNIMKWAPPIHQVRAVTVVSGLVDVIQGRPGGTSNRPRALS